MELLVERIRSSSRRVRPFRLRMGTISGAGDGAVYVDVEDVDGEYRALRDDVLRPPFCSLAFGPHVTLIHPRTSSRGPAFWSSGWRQPPVREFTTREIAITAREGARSVVLERFPVGQRGDATLRGVR